MRRLLPAILATALAATWAGFRFAPRSLYLMAPLPAAPVASVQPNQTRVTVTVPGQILIGDVAKYEDEFLAYLMYQYARNFATPGGERFWLTYERGNGGITYVIRVKLSDDLLEAVPYLITLCRATQTHAISYRWAGAATASRYEAQTDVFQRAYSLPIGRRLEHLPRAELIAYIRRFIRFKAMTDGRVRSGILNTRPPERKEAHRLAEDIVTISDFFSLPLDFFLGIGAMENNYMNVKGDLGHAIWKRRAAKGDVILRHGPKGVLVLNESSGVWQITRETLRYAHRLYLADSRDYSSLPEHLRPPATLDLNDIPVDCLTTYAGLFFRSLLDRFRGDVSLAVGAYNGGPGNPNARYEEGVRTVAEYARRIMEQAAVLQAKPAAGMRFLVPAP